MKTRLLIVVGAFVVAALVVLPKVVVKMSAAPDTRVDVHHKDYAAKRLAEERKGFEQARKGLRPMTPEDFALRRT